MRQATTCKWLKRWPPLVGQGHTLGSDQANPLFCRFFRSIFGHFLALKARFGVENRGVFSGDSTPISLQPGLFRGQYTHFSAAGCSINGRHPGRHGAPVFKASENYGWIWPDEVDLASLSDQTERVPSAGCLGRSARGGRMVVFEIDGVGSPVRGRLPVAPASLVAKP